MDSMTPALVGGAIALLGVSLGQWLIHFREGKRRRKDLLLEATSAYAASVRLLGHALRQLYIFTSIKNENEEVDGKVRDPVEMGKEQTRLFESYQERRQEVMATSCKLLLLENDVEARERLAKVATLMGEAVDVDPDDDEKLQKAYETLGEADAVILIYLDWCADKKRFM